MSYGNYPDLSHVRRVLVIKLRHLGDVLLSSPVFSCLKEAMPKAKIDAYVWKEAAPMLQGHPAIDQLILHDRSWKELGRGARLLKELELFRQIRSGGYDLVINLTEGDRGVIASLVSGARVRVGVDPGKGWKRDVLTHVVKACPNPRHTVEKDLDAVRRLGISPPNRKLVFDVAEEVKEDVNSLVGEGDYVLVHPGSRWRFKCLPAALTARMIDLLGERVVLTGASSEGDLTGEIASLAKGEVIDLAGKTSLKQMGALMLKAKGVITVDSVALHMASALQVPVVALFGPTSEENWGPWQHPRGVVVKRDLPCRPCRLDGCGGSKISDCLWTLSPEQIVEAFQSVAYPSAGTADTSEEVSLLSLNSFETNPTE